MDFNESEFRRLIDETHQTIIRLGTTKGILMAKYNRFTERLINYLISVGRPFDRDSCLQWVDSLEHDPASLLTASYIEWIAFRRFVMLIAEQEAGTLNEWVHYQSRMPEEPKAQAFQEVQLTYREYLAEDGFKESTLNAYLAYSRRLLIFLEGRGITELARIQNPDIADFFLTPRFTDRSPRSVQTEVSSLKKFLVFLSKHGHTAQESLCYALPRYRLPMNRVVNTLTSEMENDILSGERESLVDKRDKAVGLLALHAGLRSCDIRNLKFTDIDWESGILTIKQQKTGINLRIPLDNATQNAIIDYVLEERRKCDCGYIFVTAVGPIQKMKRRQYRIKYRAKGTESYERIPCDGLHIFRRTFASKLLQSGTPLPLISEMLGHIDQSSVQCYLSTDDAKMKRCSLDMSLIPYQGRNL